MKRGFLVLLSCFMVTSCVFLGWFSVASAIDIVLEPANVQRAVGEKVRVHIYADGATDLLSMGVKVSFNKDVVQVVSASKNEQDADTGWVMDADGDPGTTDDQYRTPEPEIDNANGTVVMIGGNLNGTSTTGHSGKVLLGWIVFEAIAAGNSDLSVDLGRYHPNHPTDKFNNFVRVGGVVDEPTNIPGDLGGICVPASGACSGDANGNGSVDMGDFAKVRAAMGKAFPDVGYDVTADINGNGSVDMGDFAVVRSQMGSTCPSCP